MIGVPHDIDITIPRGSRRTKGTECDFGVVAVTRNGSLNFLVYHDVNLHTSLCSSLQDLIESPVLIVKCRTAEELFV